MRGDTARLAGDVTPVHPDQEGDALRGPPAPRRSGSEKRRRTATLVIRLTPEEHATIVGKAERAGLMVGSYARNRLLESPTPRQVRRPPIERKELARLLGELGHVGANLNQLAHHANAGMPVESRGIRIVLASLVEVRNAILKALGRIE